MILLQILHSCLCFSSVFSTPTDSLVRLEEKLTTDRQFYDLWMDLIALQANQKAEQELDYPLGYVLEDVAKCPKALGDSQDHTDGLRPNDISIFAEMGHLSTYCTSNYSLLQSGVLDSCTHRSTQMQLPSFDKMLRLWNKNLTVIDSNERDDLLSEQAKHLGEAILAIPGSEDVWKMVLIIPSIQDGEASETDQTAVEVLSSIENLHELLPHKTIIIVVRTSGSGIWRDASHSHKACEEILSRWKVYNQFNQNSVWDQVEKIVMKNFQKSNFSVEILPLLRDAALSNLPSNVDLSVLGYECSHFTERGLSLVHMSIWNSLLTQASQRSHEFRPTPSTMVCPDPRCPFIRTATNSGYCLWSGKFDTPASLAPQIIVLCVLLLAVILAIIVLLVICKKPRKTDDYKVPIKAFGSSFSSIKFIDEDVA